LTEGTKMSRVDSGFALTSSWQKKAEPARPTYTIRRRKILASARQSRLRRKRFWNIESYTPGARRPRGEKHRRRRKNLVGARAHAPRLARIIKANLAGPRHLVRPFESGRRAGDRELWKIAHLARAVKCTGRNVRPGLDKSKGAFVQLRDR
jgi:hypothetical protein